LASARSSFSHCSWHSSRASRKFWASNASVGVSPISMVKIEGNRFAIISPSPSALYLHSWTFARRPANLALRPKRPMRPPKPVACWFALSSFSHLRAVLGILSIEVRLFHQTLPLAFGKSETIALQKTGPRQAHRRAPAKNQPARARVPAAFSWGCAAPAQPRHERDGVANLTIAPLCDGRWSANCINPTAPIPASPGGRTRTVRRPFLTAMGPGRRTTHTRTSIGSLPF
jgi:hypothetical protein